MDYNSHLSQTHRAEHQPSLTGHCDLGLQVSGFPFPSPQILRLPRCLSGGVYTCSAGNTGDLGLIPGSGRYPGGGDGNAFQFSCLGNPWHVTVHGSRRHSDMIKHARLPDCFHKYLRQSQHWLLTSCLVFSLPSAHSRTSPFFI